MQPCSISFNGKCGLISEACDQSACLVDGTYSHGSLELVRKRGLSKALVPCKHFGKLYLT